MPGPSDPANAVRFLERSSATKTRKRRRSAWSIPSSSSSPTGSAVRNDSVRASPSTKRPPKKPRRSPTSVPSAGGSGGDDRGRSASVLNSRASNVFRRPVNSFLPLHRAGAFWASHPFNPHPRIGRSTVSIQRLPVFRPKSPLLSSFADREEPEEENPVFKRKRERAEKREKALREAAVRREEERRARGKEEEGEEETPAARRKRLADEKRKERREEEEEERRAVRAIRREEMGRMGRGL